MGISRVFGLCAAFLIAAPVSAAVTIDLGPSDYRSYGPNGSHTSGGIRSSFGQTVRMPPAGTSLNVTRNAVIPYGSIANGTKNFLRITPGSLAASAAVTGLFMAVDWFFDEELGSWAKNEYEPDPEAGIYWFGEAAFYKQFTGPTPDVVCNQIKDSGVVGDREYSGFVFSTETRGFCEFPSPTNPDNVTRVWLQRSGDTCTPPAQYVPALGGCYLAYPAPITEADLPVLEGELVDQPPQVGADAASDIMRRQGAPLPGYHDTQMSGPSSVSGPETTTTSTDPVTGDTTVTSTQTTTNISYGDTTITTTNTTTTNTYVNGNHTKTETTTETPGELPVTDGGGAPPAGEWPGFCEWASIVCDWIGWTQEEPPAEPDLPQVIDDDFYEEKTIRFGSKSCPPDYEISVPFINSVVAVPMQPLCDFAGIIYYMVMAAAYIIAAYITIGVARNG